MERTPGTRYSFFLALTCRGARQLAGSSQAEIARLSGLQRSSINRFETSSNWPRDPEVVVRAYAEVAQLADSREIWEKALSLWREHGKDATLPLAEAAVIPKTAEEFEQAVDELVQAHLRESDGRAAGKRGTRARGAG
jgi:transcriptional regulator with XRE-family HTH domain